VVVSAAREGDMVALRVRDTGVGIPPEHLGRIFERFYRVDPARSRAEGGTGLGLAIVKHLAEAHGGRVTAESEPGRGTTVSVLLPG
jgi:signal transduction histidine kinase